MLQRDDAFAFGQAVRVLREHAAPGGGGASVLASQVLAWPHTSSSGAMKFTVHPRFLAEKHRSPGPKFGSPSSIGKQPASGRPSLPAYGFGTSTRDGALKQYAVWSFR